MRFASVLHDGTPLAVLIDGEQAIPLRGIPELGAATPLSLLRDPPLDRDSALPVGALRRRSAVPRPGKVICVGLNYAAHIEETQREQSDYPVLFTKFATTLTGPYDEIPLPPESQAIDYEGELVVVVGERGRRVPGANSPRPRRRLRGRQRRLDARLPVQDPPVAPGQGMGRLHPGRPRPGHAATRSPSRSRSGRSSTARRPRKPRPSCSSSTWRRWSARSPSSPRSSRAT